MADKPAPTPKPPSGGRRATPSPVSDQTPTPDPTELPSILVATPSPEVSGLRTAWAPVIDHGRGWVPRPWVPAAERATVGRETRKRIPRTIHATLELPADRDPIAILTEQERDRLADLVPIRHSRMAESAFAYYRGAPAVMAADLATGAQTGFIVQASGDAHISNFGLFASPERTLVFDANDFDETLAGPWEWDVKRLAASVVIASRANAFTPAQTRRATLTATETYRRAMAEYAGMRLLDIWYDKITAEDIRARFEAGVAQLQGAAAIRAASKSIDAIFAKARRKDRLRATDELTTRVDGEWRIVDDPPVVTHIEIPGGGATLAKTFLDYRASMAENRRELIERFRFVDFALKVVGVGSVGTRCFIILLEGRDEEDPLILQAKEATASVLEPHVAASTHENHGERVVVGQRLMQATPDIFLGWTRGPGGRDFYFRQLWDMKGSVDIAVLQPPGMGFYSSLCARSLARAHARSGDAVAISAYLGTGDTFDAAIADWSEAYADQNERDYAAFKAAIADGRIESKPG